MVGNRYAELRPGGTMVVIDHGAAVGSGSSVSDSLHRIDKATVIEEIAKQLAGLTGPEIRKAIEAA